MGENETQVQEADGDPEKRLVVIGKEEDEDWKMERFYELIRQFRQVRHQLTMPTTTSSLLELQPPHHHHHLQVKDTSQHENNTWSNIKKKKKMMSNTSIDLDDDHHHHNRNNTICCCCNCINVSFRKEDDDYDGVNSKNPNKRPKITTDKEDDHHDHQSDLDKNKGRCSSRARPSISDLDLNLAL